MRKPIVAVLALLVAVSFLLPAHAAKKRKVTRTAEGQYEASLGSNPGISPFWVGSPIGNVSAADFPTGLNERFVMVEIKDDHSDLTAGTVGADLDGVPETLETIADFCDKTKKPVELPGGPIRIVVKSGDCDGQVGLATSGTIVATFSNVP